MKKDIDFPKVEDIIVTVVKEKNEEGVEGWYAYLVNLKPEKIYGVLVATKGYGKKDNEDVKTSTLRHFLDTVEPNSYAQIEMIKEDLFGLSNEFWVSFYYRAQIYDKKYVFVAESIKEEHFTQVPVLNKRGVMIS